MQKHRSAPHVPRSRSRRSQMAAKLLDPQFLPNRPDPVQVRRMIATHREPWVLASLVPPLLDGSVADLEKRYKRLPPNIRKEKGMREVYGFGWNLRLAAELAVKKLSRMVDRLVPLGDTPALEAIARFSSSSRTRKKAEEKLGRSPTS